MADDIHKNREASVDKKRGERERGVSDLELRRDDKKSSHFFLLPASNMHPSLSQSVKKFM
jgi:hypothetical protein